MSGIGRVLVVDDETPNRNLLARFLKADGYETFEASNGAEALSVVAAHPPDVVLSDVNMPGVDGFSLCRSIKAGQHSRFVPVVLMTGMGSRESRLAGIHAGADDFLRKPVDRQELRARVKSLVRLKRSTDDLESAESVIISLARTIEARDTYTNGHCERLAAYSTALGRDLDLSPDDLEALRRGGYLHDVGKIGVPDAVLFKQGRLEPDEYALIKQHPVIGERLCGELRSLRDVRQIVRHHHELLDGSGYPDGLRGGAVPLLAQIVAIADVYDAVTTDRPYRRAKTADAAYRELRADAAAGKRRTDLVERFIALGERGVLDLVSAVSLELAS
ncbi:MAG TPA: HD domain-containing phosphohydrolase [Vicinamibacterales bacterium]|nr:HD domain-containing phosphohydrolase [Vicinamibacterales bacterium]